MLTAVLARQAAAAVSVGTYWPWETTAALPSARRRKALRRPRGEERGGGIPWWPPPTAFLNLLRVSARSLLSAGVCPSVTFVYCIQTAKDIVKLFSQSGSGSPVILIFDPKRRYPIPRGTPSAGSLNTPGVGKICDFRLKSPFISETVRDRPILLWNVNRKWRIDPCRFR